MATEVCPWWYGYFIDNPLRRLIFAPERLFSSYVRPGMTVLDIGCGMGVNSLALARLVGPEGRVIAVDIQPRMLAAVRKRALRKGLGDRIECRLSTPESMGISGGIAFAVAFWMVHEAPDARALFAQVHSCLLPDGAFFVAEPSVHVTGKQFAGCVDIALESGLAVRARPKVPLSRAIVFERAA